MSENYNVLQISEIHAFEESGWSKDHYLSQISEQVNNYVDFYKIDELWILGDTGSFDDVEKLLEGIDDVPVRIIAGDEDKDSKQIGGEYYIGWYIDQRTDSLQPFDTDLEYKIFDEGFETLINGIKIQAAHHPNKDKRENRINPPDNRDSEFLKDLFSLKRHDNENTLEEIPPRNMRDADLFIYDHVHMPYARSIGDKIAMGLGGRRHNYQRDSECVPERSLHISSFGDGTLSLLHFDADEDMIAEHLAFDREQNQLFDVHASRYENSQSGYKPIQSRFRNDQISPDSHESLEEVPFWENRQ